MKNVLIVGGGTGIGHEIAHIMYSKNYRVTCVGRKQRINFEYDYIECDVSNSDAVISLFKNKSYDILVYCAGVISQSEESYSYNNEEMNYIIDNNLKGCIICNQLFIDKCIENKINGKIINISSISNRGSKFFPIYASTKAGILTYTKSIASRYEGIQANVISPGVIKTDMSYYETPNFDEYVPDIIDNTPAKRLGSPLDVANMALFLVSDNASFITGQEFIVDGGYSLPKE